MLTKELKKGDFVLLRSNWRAELLENCRGNTPVCKVWGLYTEAGSVYAHDIVYKIEPVDGRYTECRVVIPDGSDEDGGAWAVVATIELTQKQRELKNKVAKAMY